MVFNAIISTVALAFLAWLLLIHQGFTDSGVDLSFMPAVNACLNAAAATCLLFGFFAIKAGKRALHMRLMVSAFACSAVFLIGYVLYHAVHGDTRYEGGMRGLYLAILASHVLLSMAIVPGALATFYYAWRKRFDRHRRVARVLWPILMYVSVTGVVIFFMLHG